MSSVSKQQVKDVLQEIGTYINPNSTFTETMIAEISDLSKRGTPESLAKLQRLKSLLKSIFEGRDLGRLDKKYYKESGHLILVRDMLDGDYLCYREKGNTIKTGFVFLTCLQQLP